MDDNEIFEKLNEISMPQFSLIFGEENEQAIKIAEHKNWLQTIRHEHPSPNKRYKIGIYIRYFNQTKYENYLSYHIKQFSDTIALCPNWTLVDFYVDEGQAAPNMETAPQWSRLVSDAMEGKIDLIITQKVSNVSRKMSEVTLCSRILATQNPPIGIYFISEDIFTLATYYQADLKDTGFFPTNDWQILPENDYEAKALLKARSETDD